jgi:hypothetical protein
MATDSRQQLLTPATKPNIKPKEFSFLVTKQPKKKKKKIVNLNPKPGGGEEEDWSIVTC